MGGVPSRVRVTGPLAVFAEGFAGELARLGYKPNAAADQLRLMAHLSRWMDTGQLEAAELTPQVTGAFLVARRAEGYVLWLSPRALVPLLGYLRGLGVAPQPAAAPVPPAEALLGRYRRYLVTERGLAGTTVRGYADMVRPFLAGRDEADGLGLDQLTAAEVTRFVLATCPGLPKGSAKLTVTAVPARLLARRGADWRAAGAARAVCGQLAAGRAASCAGTRAGGRAAGQLRSGHLGRAP
jgi:integrase/recombinase XerD